MPGHLEHSLFGRLLRGIPRNCKAPRHSNRVPHQFHRLQPGVVLTQLYRRRDVRCQSLRQDLSDDACVLRGQLVLILERPLVQSAPGHEKNKPRQDIGGSHAAFRQNNCTGDVCMHDRQYTVTVAQINGTAAAWTLNRSAISLNFNRCFVEQNKTSNAPARRPLV